MPTARVLSTTAVLAVIAGCAALVVAMARTAPSTPSALVSALPTPASQHLIPATPADTTPTNTTPTNTTPTNTTPTNTGPAPSASATVPTPASSSPTSATAPSAQPPAAPRANPPAPPLTTGQALPLGSGTGAATQVITVVGSSTSATTAVLQAWDRAPGGGWLPHGGSMTAHVGADGLSTQPSESRSATPIGSFTLTQAFGHDADPGTALPYFQTTPADWWISQLGPLYNTHQNCASGCPFAQAAPNEHLYYETPFYDYAVVIDYNTANAGSVSQGAGSAFFLHVTDGNPTAGCVSIPAPDLIATLRWLQPADHPRILIGVG